MNLIERLKGIEPSLNREDTRLAIANAVKQHVEEAGAVTSSSLNQAAAYVFMPNKPQDRYTFDIAHRVYIQGCLAKYVKVVHLGRFIKGKKGVSGGVEIINTGEHVRGGSAYLYYLEEDKLWDYARKRIKRAKPRSKKKNIAFEFSDDAFVSP